MSTPPPNTPNDQPRNPQQQAQPQSPASNPQQGQHQGPPAPGRYSGQHPGAQYPGAPGAPQPGGNPGKPPMDPLQRQRILLRAAMVLVVSALLIFGASWG